jgi:hypothetical protein
VAQPDRRLLDGWSRRRHGYRVHVEVGSHCVRPSTAGRHVQTRKTWIRKHIVSGVSSRELLLKP